jgi:hypothetical protein
MRAYERALAARWDDAGRFPASLDVHRLPSRYGSPPDFADEWGNPLRYESRGESYILVSYGRGGVPDGIDYWDIQAEKTAPGKHCWDSRVYRDGQYVGTEENCFEWDENYIFPKNICGNWSADQVFSNRGEHIVCGK